MIPARKVKYAPGAKMRYADPGLAIAPQVVSLQGRRYWMSLANGAAVISITEPEEADFAAGRLAVLVYEDARPGFTEGLALARSLDPDQADEFADQLKAFAAIVRKGAAEQASALIMKVAGK